MQHAPAVTQTLARFAVEARWDDVPDAARHEAKRALMNFFAVALAGCRAPPVEHNLSPSFPVASRRP